MSKYTIEKTEIAYDASNPQEVEWVELFKMRVAVARIEHKLLGQPLIIRKPARKLAPSMKKRAPLRKKVGRPKKDAPDGKNREALRHAAEYGFDTETMTKLLFGEFTDNNKHAYYKRRSTTWTDKGWVVTHGRGNWEVTDKLRSML